MSTGIKMSSIYCITVCGITLLLHVYFHMRGYTFPRVFPHVEIHVKWCKSSFGIYTLPHAFPHVEIHLSLRFTASEKKKKPTPYAEIHIF